MYSDTLSAITNKTMTILDRDVLLEKISILHIECLLVDLQPSLYSNEEIERRIDQVAILVNLVMSVN